MTTTTRTGYAPVHDLHMYYEIHGSGHPLLLIHGGLGSTGMFEAILPQLAAVRQVIAVDLQAHGRTADIDRPFSAQRMADDVAALLEQLDITGADVMGYSLGGSVALRLAIQHPTLVTRLIVVSAAISRDDWYPAVREGMKQMNASAESFLRQSPIYAAYVQVAPRPEDFPILLDKTGEMIRQEYDWSQEFAALKMPVFLAYGDADSISPARAARSFELLGGGKADGGWDRSGMTNSRLAILPDTTHYTIFSSPALVAAVIPFLETPLP